MVKKVFFKTFGCKVNQYESEYIRAGLSQSGYATTDDFAKADWCVINSCTVTGESDTKCRHFVRKILKENDRCSVVVTGCYAQRSAQDLTLLSPRVSVVGQQQKNDIIALIAGKAAGTAGVPSSLTSFHNHSRAFLKVQDGCDAFCSYCIVPYVRAAVYSRDAADVMRETKTLVNQGYKEIVLTGIRLGKYTNGSIRHLSELVDAVLSIDGDFRVRLSSLEVLEINDQLLSLMKQSSKLCHHLHIPLQSGDNDILKRMNRPYTVEEFTEIILRVKNAVPDIGITTDVIVGYPGETALQFENTFNILNILAIGRIHSFRFSPRIGTSAASEPQPITHQEINMRMSVMKVIAAILKNNFAERFLDTPCRVVPEQERHGTVHGFTDNYIKVALPPRPAEASRSGFVYGRLKNSSERGFYLEL
jgi:threonylcarbamoyladenosine tRNA methylthiotransferase MtaB